MSPASRGPQSRTAEGPRLIKRVTRKNLLDWMTGEQIQWSGRLEEDQFLGRIFDLDEMPSTDSRFKDAAGDIWQHRVNNPNDWTDDWLFTDSRFNLLGCPDETFLTVVAEMLHPSVRRDPEEAQHLAAAFNDILRDDGYELFAAKRVAGKPIWAGRRRSLAGTTGVPALRSAREKFDADHILRQITRMEAAVEDDPGLAIGTAKELLETTCHAILELRGKPVKGREDLPKLVRMVTEELGLVPDGVSPTTRNPETVKRILGSLAVVASGIAELRNAYGTGHGRAPGARRLGPRHAKLAVGAAATLSVFLFETNEDQTTK